MLIFNIFIRLNGGELIAIFTSSKIKNLILNKYKF